MSSLGISSWRNRLTGGRTKCHRTKCHGQNVADKSYVDKMSLDNITDKMSRTKCSGKNVVDKMSWTQCHGQKVVDKMAWSKCRGQNVLINFVDKLQLANSGWRMRWTGMIEQDCEMLGSNIYNAKRLAQDRAGWKKCCGGAVNAHECIVTTLSQVNPFFPSRHQQYKSQ